VEKERRLVDQPMSPARPAGDLGKEVLDNTLARFFRVSLASLFCLFIRRRGNKGFSIQPRLPDFKRTHP
jgi:hypothetical protein